MTTMPVFDVNASSKNATDIALMAAYAMREAIKIRMNAADELFDDELLASADDESKTSLYLAEGKLNGLLEAYQTIEMAISMWEKKEC